MKIEPVEIYSDASNAAVMRHPGRNFPGVLVQGDTLHSIVSELEELKTAMLSSNPEVSESIGNLYGRLDALLQHYKAVLAAHSIQLPFHDASKS
jgi:hypothetical protein